MDSDGLDIPHYLLRSPQPALPATLQEGEPDGCATREGAAMTLLIDIAEPAHSRFGGSVATRVLRCPASVGLVEKVPAYLRKVSAYAERGTACHMRWPC